MMPFMIMRRCTSKEVSIAEAKSRLSTWVRSAEHGEVVVITRRGKPVAALVPAAELARLARLRAAGPQAGLAGIAGGWEGAEELVELLEALQRSSGRALPDLA